MSSAAKDSVDPRWRSGRSPATPDRLRERKVPHFNPLCNTFVGIRPTSLESGTASWCTKSLQIGRVSGWEESRRAPEPGPHDRVHRPAFARSLALPQPAGRTLRRHASRRAARAPRPPSLLVAGCGSGAASGGDDPAGAVPADAAIYVDATRAPGGRAARRRAGGRGQGAAHLRPAGQDRRARQEDVRGVRGPQARLRARHRAVAGREGRAVGRAHQRRGGLPRRADRARRPTRTPRRRRSTAPSRAARRRSASAATRASTTRRSTESAAGLVEDFVGDRHRGGVQAHDRRGQGRRARGRRPLPQGRSTPSRTTGSAPSTSTSGR